jgi:hypothetical protein
MRMMSWVGYFRRRDDRPKIHDEFLHVILKGFKMNVYDEMTRGYNDQPVRRQFLKKVQKKNCEGRRCFTHYKLLDFGIDPDQ